MAHQQSLNAEERNIRLLIEYDGSAYSGWQRQPGQATIQGSVEAAIQKMTGTAPALQVAGRTDSGVHALAQVANFKVVSKTPAWQFARGINHFLPRDISIHTSCEVPPGFNSRFDSVSKRYRYRVYQGPQPTALDRGRAWWLLAPMDLSILRQGANLLRGEHDFNAFRSTHCDAEHAVRLIHSIEIEQSARPPLGRYTDITFHANAFCRHMCRILAGTLVETALGKRSLAGISTALASRKRTAAGVTAPPGGLTLLEVLYPTQASS